MLVPNNTPTTSSYGTALGVLGIGSSIAGIATSAIGSYYAVKAVEYQARSQASALEYQQQMAWINARAAERDAQQSILAGHREAGRAGLRYRQLRGAVDARRGARGVQAGVGSEGEVAASIELAKEMDQLAITRNAVRAANASRLAAVGASSRAQMAGVSAANVLRQSSVLSARGAAFTSLIGGAGQVARDAYLLYRSS